jgi:drug/metabolite transporter (DMT)-like permease
MSALVLARLRFPHHRFAPGLMSIVILSVLSAAAYGLGAVLQHHEASTEPPELATKAGLLVRLARRPLWLLGSALDGVGYLFQFLALRRGSLALVEPLLVLSLVFALPVAARLEHRRIAVSELRSVAVTVTGLALFLVVAHPALGHPTASWKAWLVLSSVIAALCAAMALGAHAGSPRRAALLYSAASGTAFGYVAAVTERTGHLLDRGVLHTLATWPPYALAAGAVVALALTQSGFQAGVLRLSLPTLTIGQPLVALVIGIGFFGERVDARGVRPVVEALGLAMMTVGVYLLARSPVIAAPADRPEVR